MKKEYRMVAIDPQLHGELKRYCVLHGVTITELVSKLVQRCITQERRSANE